MEYRKAKATIVNFTQVMLRNRKLVHSVFDMTNLWQNDDASCY